MLIEAAKSQESTFFYGDFLLVAAVAAGSFGSSFGRYYHIRASFCKARPSTIPSVTGKQKTGEKE